MAFVLFIDFYLLLALINFSKAIVIEGDSFVGAIRSTRSLSSSAACWVVSPNTPIFVSSCLKSGKFSNRERTPCGLKKITRSYSFMLTSCRLLQTVLYIIALFHSTPASFSTFGMSSVKTSEDGRRYFSVLCFFNNGKRSFAVFRQS